MEILQYYGDYILLGIIFAILMGMYLKSVICKVILIRKKKHRDIIEANSHRIEMLRQINDAYYFEPLNPVYGYLVQCNTKAQWDNFDYDSYFANLIMEDKDFYITIINAAVRNSNDYDDYISQVEKLSETISEEECVKLNISYQKAVRLENELFESFVQDPIVNPHFEITSTYISPKGRNYYSNVKIYDLSGLQYYLNEANKLQEMKQTKSYQRRLMTPGLRMKILTRDNYRCQICGLSAAEGARLEVDHIIPIAKGGKTIESNLQTLCWECNRGKSDKY